MEKNMFSLQGKSALITGGRQGIGFAIAEAMAAQGASVIHLSGRSAAPLEAACADLARRFGIEAHPLVFDVADKRAVRAALDEVAAKGRGLDILVNNAGVNLRGPLESLEEELWDTVIATNLKGTFLVSQAAFPLLSAKGGKIVNISSLMAEMARPNLAPYASSKGGVRQLTKVMAAEWASHKIQVNAIAPGFIATELNTALMNDNDFNERLMLRMPEKAWGKPSSIGACAVFLASPGADYITGQTIVVDGGFLNSF